jgi:hypothetical protein
MVEQLRVYYLIPGGIVRLVQQDAASGYVANPFLSLRVILIPTMNYRITDSRMIKPSSGATTSPINHTQKMSHALSTLKSADFETSGEGRVHLHRRASMSKGVNSGSATNGGLRKRSRNTLNGQAKGPCILGSVTTRMNLRCNISKTTSRSYQGSHFRSERYYLLRETRFSRNKA